jgi:hypothetical protein
MKSANAVSRPEPEETSQHRRLLAHLMWYRIGSSASDGPLAGLRLRPTRIGFAQVSLNKSSAKEEEFLTTVLQRFLGNQHG